VSDLPSASQHDSDPRNAAYEDDSFHAFLDELSSRPVGAGRIDRMRSRFVDSAERLTTWGPLGPVTEIGWKVYRRDQEIAGTVLAAALAYRIFIWLLPLALVLVAGLGLVSINSAAVASDLGLSGFVAESVTQASSATGVVARLAILISGTIVFFYESYALLRTLRAISAFSWRIPVRPMKRPFHTVALFVMLGIITMAVISLGNRAAQALPFPASALLSLVVLLIIPLFYLLIASLMLPNRAPNLMALVPGAVLIYASYTVTHLVATLVVMPWIAHKQAAYGVLGISAGVLFLLFVFGRVLAIACMLNAVLLDTQHSRSRA